MSHSKPQRSVASRSARSSATIAIRSAIELGLLDRARSRSSGGRRRPARARRANSARVLARKPPPLSHAPWPGVGAPHLAARRSDEQADQRPARADQRDRHRPAGAPADEIARAVDRIDQPASARARAARGRRRSPPTASRRPAAARPSSRLRKASTSRSAAHTGLPGTLLPALERVPAARPLPQRHLRRPRGRFLRGARGRSSRGHLATARRRLQARARCA